MEDQWTERVEGNEKGVKVCVFPSTETQLCSDLSTHSPQLLHSSVENGSGHRSTSCVLVFAQQADSLCYACPQQMSTGHPLSTQL